MSINRMKKYISIIVFIAIGICSGYSQTQKAFRKAADEAMVSKNYYGALTWYMEALDFDRDDPELIYKVAESARLFKAYDLAAEKYKLIVDSLGQGNYPDASLYLGQMYQQLGKYEDAQNYYNIYVSENSGENEELTQMAKDGLESVEYALVKIEDMHF